jgi:hypothetical protein
LTAAASRQTVRIRSSAAFVWSQRAGANERPTVVAVPFSMEDDGGDGECREQRTHILKKARPRELIRLPEPPWNGDLSAIGPEHRTYVNLRALGDLAERVAQAVESLANAGELAIVLPDGAAELRAQFVFAVYP